MGRPSKEERRDTRSEILEAALELYAEGGYHATSMRALAAAVGVRESAIYHYFPSKEAVLGAILDDVQEGRSALLEEEAASFEERSLEEILLHLTTRLMDFLGEPRQRKLIRLVLGAGPARSGDEISAARVITERGRKQMLSLFQKLRRSGRIRDDVEFEIFLSHFLGPILLAINALWLHGEGPMTLPARRFVREHVAFLLRALVPPRGRSG